jgi:hypothetical protein
MQNARTRQARYAIALMASIVATERPVLGLTANRYVRLVLQCK